MSRKTVIKLNLSRNAPLSAELRQAVTFDQAVIREPEVPTYVDNEPKDVDTKIVLEYQSEEWKKVVRDYYNGITMEQLHAKYDFNDDLEAVLCNEVDLFKNQEVTYEEKELF